MTERTVKHRGTEERRHNGAEDSTRRREAAAHAGQERAHEPSAFPERFVRSLLTGLSRRPALQAVRVECAPFSVRPPFLRVESVASVFSLSSTRCTPLKNGLKPDTTPRSD